MAIFTFMGSSILRQDDAYSFQVISKLVETIIPVLIEVSMIEKCIYYFKSFMKILEIIKKIV